MCILKKVCCNLHCICLYTFSQGVDRVLESFLVLNDEERLQLQKKRASKQRKRQRAAGEDDSLTTADRQQLSVEDQHRRHEAVRVPSAKLSSISDISTTGAAENCISKEGWCKNCAPKELLYNAILKRTE